MSEFEQNLSSSPNNFLEFSQMIESGEGEISAPDLRRLADTEEVPENLRSMVKFAADLIEERDKWGVDSLTGLMTESRLNRALEGIYERSKRSGEAISIALYDLDKLKAANSAGEGHKGGDRLIKVFAQNLGEVFNPEEGEFRTGIIGRWRRGDEFLVVIRGDEKTALDLDNEFQRRLKNQKIKINGQYLPVAATGSVCELKQAENLEDQLAETSQKLLAKKDVGKKSK